MRQFPANIKFKYPWRAYQKRVLDELDKHLNDNHLHVVAPPGSGKTVLGLEVAIRLNRPTLILSPSIAIQNQWIERFCELFLQDFIPPVWISRDIRKPSFLTSVTYQGLHAAVERDGAETIFKALQAVGVETVIIDEAHHLKNAWWKSLDKVKQVLKPTMVGLTATPPYDVSATEWNRYIDMNGPVDSEISVPELVAAGDLCAHQDFIIFSTPSDEESAQLRKFKDEKLAVVQELVGDNTLRDALAELAFFKFPLQHTEWIYDNIETYSAVVIFLKAADTYIGEEHFEVIGDTAEKVPPLTDEWLAVLLDFYLYEEKLFSEKYDEHRARIQYRLRQSGLVEHKRVQLGVSSSMAKMLRSSKEKLSSIVDIAAYEYKVLGDDLRMVILADFIRKEFIDAGKEADEIDRVGVVPIFEKLRQLENQSPRLGILSGSLVVIPHTARLQLQELMAKYDVADLNMVELPSDPKFLQISVGDAERDNIVRMITALFELGEIEVLVGTKSLLGEGWDAPAINSLILASFVGSFVLSNQMRGRAIRMQQDNPRKVSNIWHLVSTDPTDETGGSDFEVMVRRFKAFVGVNQFGKAEISNDISRLQLPAKMEIASLEDINKRMFRHAGKRSLLLDRWKQALLSGRLMVEEVQVAYEQLNRRKDIPGNRTAYVRNTSRYTLLAATIGIAAYLSIPLALANLPMAAVFGIPAIGGLLFTAVSASKNAWIALKFRSISKDLEHIARATLDTLHELGHIASNPAELEIITSHDYYGQLLCWIQGGTAAERALFVKCISDITGPVENPRYIIIRKSKTRLYTQRDYHSIPEIFSRKKATADCFGSNWKKLVGNCELVYTRSLEGRKVLLKARVNSYASTVDRSARRVSKWR